MKSDTPSKSSTTSEVQVLWNEFREQVIASYTPAEQDLLDASFELACKAHQQQVRKSGEPYILHPLSVCEILLDINMDCTGICSALLHDVVEDSEYTINDIAKLTNPTIATIVEGCTKLKSNSTNSEAPITQYYRNIITKSGQDIRTLIVKLADRLHNMRTLHHLNSDKAKRISLETEQIYAPLARRLGLYFIYTEMLDLCFKINHPMRFDAIDTDRKAILQERSASTNEWKQELEDIFLDRDKDWSLIDIPRSNYAIYRRLKLVKHEGSKIGWLVGGGQFALVTKTADECYEALGCIHNFDKFQPINSNVIDFISMPKVNGYQSLHTQVYGSEGKRIMFAIRSKSMHQRAYLGVMSYSNDLSDRGVKELITLSNFEQTDTLFLNELTNALDPLRIYVFDTNGNTIHLPRGATALDFAYALNVQDAHRVSSAQVDNEIVPLFSELPNYCQVKLEYAETNQVDKNRLKFVSTPRAKQEIQQLLKSFDKQTQYNLGAKLLFSALKNSTKIAFAHHTWETFQDDKIILQQCEKLLTAARMPSIDTIIEELSNGYRDKKILEKQLELACEDQLTFRDLQAQIMNIDGINFNLCKHCQPLPDEQVFGLFENQSLVIHNNLCNLEYLDQKQENKIMHLEWDQQSNFDYSAWLKVDTKDRKGVLLTVLNAIDTLDINVTEIITQTDQGIARFLIAIKVKNYNQLQKCIDSVNQTQVNSISRYFPQVPNENN